MVDCARERYANADTAAAVRFLETVLVPKVTAAYLDTMCASYKGSRDPRVKLSFFKGQPTDLIEEVTRKITDELIEKSIEVFPLPEALGPAVDFSADTKSNNAQRPSRFHKRRPPGK